VYTELHAEKSGGKAMTETAVAVNAVYSEQELKKDSQVSVRLESGLFEALETQTKVWGFKSISQTVRAILTFYFLPVVYELELKNRSISEHKEFLKEKQEEGFSLEQAKANYFTFQVVEYLEFLEQAMVMARHSLKFMESTSDKMNGILRETVNKIEQAMKELEQGAE
jgi:regulatory protein YycI of two-component signal transduction system YycFG